MWYEAPMWGVVVVVLALGMRKLLWEPEDQDDVMSVLGVGAYTTVVHTTYDSLSSTILDKCDDVPFFRAPLQAVTSLTYVL